MPLFSYAEQYENRADLPSRNNCARLAFLFFSHDTRVGKKGETCMKPVHFSRKNKLL